MKEVILVRYAEYENGHISHQGTQTMKQLAAKLKAILGNEKIVIAAAAVDRALESGQVLASELGIGTPIEAPALYAAEEDGQDITLTEASAFLHSFAESCDTLIAIASREYIEVLPRALSSHAPESVALQRGEALRISLTEPTLQLIR